MMRLAFLLMTMSMLASALAPAPADAGGVTGAGDASLPPGVTFNGIPVSGLSLGQGLFIAEDGSAYGQFFAVIHGRSLLGGVQDVTIEGEVRDGLVRGDGTVTFSGNAALDLGDGTPPFLAVPFTVTASEQSLALILNTMAFPTAALSPLSSITIE